MVIMDYHKLKNCMQKEPFIEYYIFSRGNQEKEKRNNVLTVGYNHTKGVSAGPFVIHDLSPGL